MSIAALPFSVQSKVWQWGRIGEVSSKIYAAGLQFMERKISKCRSDPTLDDVVDLPDSNIFMTKQLAAVLDKSVNPSMGIGKGPGGDPSGRRSKKSAGTRGKGCETNDDTDMDIVSDDESRVNGHTDTDNDDEDIRERPTKRSKVTFQEKPADVPEDSENRNELVKKHLSLLEADSAKLLRKCGSNSYGEWRCNYDNAVMNMQEDEFDTVLLENFGLFGHRLARMLRTLGKLEEKYLADTAKLKIKDVRAKLAEMHRRFHVMGAVH